MQCRPVLLPITAILITVGTAACGHLGKPDSTTASTSQATAPMQKVLDSLASLDPKPIATLSPEQARQQPTPADAVKQLLTQQGKSTEPDPGVMKRTVNIPGPNGDIPLHIFTPEGQGPFPVMVYYHGGGFVIADTKTYEASVRALAKMANAIMVSVDYHRAPEHKFPAAPQDAFTAYDWVLKNASKINGDPNKVAVGGESAGGNLATVVSMLARDHQFKMPVHQLLVYPVVNNDFTTPSYQQHSDAKPLNKPMMEWFFKHYSAKPEDASNPYAVPMKAQSLKGLPPATIIAAEIDPLLSEGKSYAQRLEKEGVPVQYKAYSGVTHEFFGMGKVVPKALEAEQFAAEQLKQAFAAAR